MLPSSVGAAQPGFTRRSAPVPLTRRALTGPTSRYTDRTNQAWQQELLLTLRRVREIRLKCDTTEVGTIREARKARLS